MARRPPEVSYAGQVNADGVTRRPSVVLVSSIVNILLKLVPAVKQGSCLKTTTTFGLLGRGRVFNMVKQVWYKCYIQYIFESCGLWCLWKMLMEE